MALSEIVEEWGGSYESPMGFYTDVFHIGEGYIQREGEQPGQFKANPLIIGHDGKRMHRKILFEDTFAETLAEFCEYDWAFVSGCSYFGRSNSAERQSKLFALIFDLDGVTDETLNNFFFGCSNNAYPVPQHIALSGHGVHLYFVFEEPIALFPNIKTQLKQLKYELTNILWNMHTSTDKHRQYQGINQAFRAPGSKVKPSAGSKIVTAYRVNAHPTSIGELNDFCIHDESRVDLSKIYPESRWTLDEAREKFPEWYERVILNHDRGQWVVKPDLYEWWKRRAGEATYHHRYFFVMMMAIFAAKCGIYDRERVKADALDLVPMFCELNPGEPFTETDIDSALECLDARYVTFPRIEIARLSDLAITPQIRRNGRRQVDHLARARALRDFDYPDGGWRDGNSRKGRPNKRHPKADAIRAYAAEHPDTTQREIAAALGVSKTTVNKWLKGV